MKLRVLMVPDLLPWITGSIAKQIAHHNEDWLEATIVSGLVLRDLIERCGGFPGEVDLVHFLTEGGAELHLAHFEGKVPCLLTVHHVEDERYATLGPRCDAIMTSCSQWNDYLKEHGFEADRLGIVPYGVDTDRFRPAGPGERADLRASLGLPPDVFVVGFFAKRSSDTTGRKGTDTLLRAVATLRERLPRVSILVVGPGWSDLVEQMQAEGVPCAHIPFIPDPDEFANVYRCLDAYWITSRIEGGPVPLLEAMASGVCCITTPVGMAPDLVRDGENALIAPIDDAEAFVRHTERLVNDPDLGRLMGEAARRTIVDRYQWRQSSRHVWPLYRTAIDHFRTRKGGAEVPVMPEPGWGNPRPAASDRPRLHALPIGVHNWVMAREFFLFTFELRRMGEGGLADRLDLEAMRPSQVIDPGWGSAGFDGSVRNYWWSFHRGERRLMIVHGLRAIRCRPWWAGGWRLLALALLKKLPERGAA